MLQKQCTRCGVEFETKVAITKFCIKCRKNKLRGKHEGNSSEANDLELDEGTNVKLFDILSADQQKQFVNASPQRQLWLIEFVKTGSMRKAGERAYPKANQGSRNTINSYLSSYFGITVADIFRAMGIHETKIAEKTMTLLDAKKQVRTFRKGDLIEEVEQEDSFAIDAGIKHATKLLKIDPGQKLLHGEDPEHKFTSLSDALKAITSGQVVQQRPEEAPNQ